MTSNSRSRLMGLAALATLTAGLFVLIGDGSDAVPGQPSPWMLFAVSVVYDGGYLAAWLAAAAGYGWVLQRWRWVGAGDPHEGRPTHHRGAWGVRLTLGGSVLILLAWLLGWWGWLNVVSAWVVLAVGWWGLVLVLRGELNPHEGRRTGHRGAWGWPVILGGPAMAVLLVASTVAPGALWQPTEMGAYDVLSYHLQLPKEWLAAGAMTGLHHNVYSYLPSGFEAVFYHLAVLRGGAVEAAISCQLLHAAMTVIVAMMIASLVRQLAVAAGIDTRIAEVAGGLAGVIYLAVPWVIVTGSLAYNEQAMAAMGAAALAVAFNTQTNRWRRGFIAGLLIGVAMLCKLTAVGFFALPVAVVLMVQGQRRWTALLTFALGAALPVGLFMVRNWMWTGNPVFPMLSDLFGLGHWTAEQAARWDAAHSPDLSWLERGHRIVTHLLLHNQYGYALWPGAVIGLVVLIIRSATRRVALLLGGMLVIQLLFWLGMTHVQSRFMVAAVVPAVILIGLAMASIRLPLVRLGVAILLVGLFTLVSFRLYLQQQQGRASQYIGLTVAMQHDPLLWGRLNELPDDVRIYAEGYATPLYFTRPITYHTVWDASPLGRLIDDHGVRGAISELRQQGYTHLLIDRYMLNLWQSPGNYGYDPSITPQRLAAIDALGLPTLLDVGGSVVVYVLQPVSD